VEEKHMRTWITPEEAVPYTPWKSRWNIYERIREGKFPFPYKRSGRSILIYAPALMPQTTANEKTQEGAQSLATETPAYA
jgi:hypothetical protein